MNEGPDAASEEPGAEESVVPDGTELDAIEGLENIDGLVRAGRFDEARAALDALDPSARATPTARTSAARLALAQGRGQDAVRELEPLVATEEASASVLALHARALLATGRVGAAARTYQDSMELDPNLPEALFGRAQMAVRARRGRTALYFLDRLDRALATVPRPPAFVARARVLRGRALLADGHGADARRTLAEVIANDHAPSDAFFYFAESEIGHDHRAAREAYRRYLDLEPNGYYARRARHALQLDE